MKNLDIFVGSGIAIPIDLITQKSAILARTGAGKSTAAAAIVEELLDAKQQVVILDPKGDWWGLRSSADGTASGFPITVFGGSSAARSLDLEPRAGGLIAELAAEGVSMVIDLSEFSNRERNEFVTDFAERFYRAKSEHNDPVLLVLEEADEVVPQRVDAANARMVGAIERIVKRGRFRGIGTLLITQRSASLNKDVLTQTEVLIVMQTTSPQDRKAIDAWIEHHPDQEKIRAITVGMATLKQGEAFIWSPSWLEIFAQVKFRRRRTYDAGQTPRVGERRTPPKVLADVDIKKLGERIQATIEHQKATDPAELRRTIATLRSELAKVSKTDVSDALRVARLEVADLRASLRTQEEARKILEYDYQNALNTISRAQDALSGAAPSAPRLVSTASGHDRAASGTRALSDGAGPVRATPAPAASQHRPSTATRVPGGTGAGRVQRSVRSGEASRRITSELTRPQQRVLDALAWREQVALASSTPKKMLAALSNYTWSGGFRNILSALKQLGLIEYVGTEEARLTDDGRAQANSISQPATNDEAHDAAMRKVKGEPLKKVLRAIIEAHPHGIDKQSLAEQIGYEWSGGFRNLLSKLRTLGYVDYPTPNSVKAQAVLFPEEVARA